MWDFWAMKITRPNQLAGANAGERLRRRPEAMADRSAVAGKLWRDRSGMPASQGLSCIITPAGLSSGVRPPMQSYLRVATLGAFVTVYPSLRHVTARCEPSRYFGCDLLSR